MSKVSTPSGWPPIDTPLISLGDSASGAAATPLGATIAPEGTLTEPWRKWFIQITPNKGRVVQTITPGPTPYTYTATMVGHVLVSGGTGVSIRYTRGKETLSTGITAGFIPVAVSDAVEVTYTDAPTMTFIPAPGT